MKEPLLRLFTAGFLYYCVSLSLTLLYISPHWPKTVIGWLFFAVFSVPVWLFFEGIGHLFMDKEFGRNFFSNTKMREPDLRLFCAMITVLAILVGGHYMWPYVEPYAGNFFEINFK